MGVYASDDVVVLTAGKAKHANEQTREVFVATPKDGRIGEWKSGPPLPAGRFHLSTTYLGGALYAIGGLDDAMVSTKTVYRATLDGDRLGTWSEATPLPDTRSHHVSFAWHNFLYVIGGVRGNPNDDATLLLLKDILRAEVRADGSLGPWISLGDLDAPLSAGAAAVVDDAVILSGGFEEDLVATVRRGRLRPDGSLGDWDRLTPLPTARAHMHQTPVWDHTLFAVAGNALDAKHEYHPIAEVSIAALPLLAPRP
jgi:N-acetylneuraminic acid mutarotase